MLKFIDGRPAMNMAEGDAVVPPAGGGSDKPWYDGAAAEDVGYLQNRGWDKVDAKTAALNAGKAHREAEKLIGAPADKIVRLPADPNDAEGWRQVQRKLGAPADEKGYDFSVIKHADGTVLEDAFASAMKARALKLGLKPTDATEMVSELVKMGDASEAAEATEAAGKLALEKTKLDENWGPKADTNLFIAKQTAAALGVTPEQVAAAEKIVGYAALMEMFRNIGSKIGEDRFVVAPGGGNPGPMSKEAAMDRLSSLKADKVWVASYLNGDAEKAKEMAALNAMIAKR